MNIEYVKLDPTGNTTLLVKTPIARNNQAALAAWLLERVGGEQMGYIEAPGDSRAVARLQMMGGEFCGNATMSLGAVLARQACLPHGEGRDFPLEVSGNDALVSCRVRREGDGWLGTVGMPLPTGLRTFIIEAHGKAVALPLIEMPGISHLILPVDLRLDEARLRDLLPRWCKQLGAEALGALTLDEDAMSIDPLVYVPAAGTLVREHGCGSGSAAVGCWLARRAGHSLTVPIRQSGGTILVDAALEKNRLASVRITGQVRLVEEGTVSTEA